MHGATMVTVQGMHDSILCSVTRRRLRPYSLMRFVLWSVHLDACLCLEFTTCAWC